MTRSTANKPERVVVSSLYSLPPSLYASAIRNATSAKEFCEKGTYDDDVPVTLGRLGGWLRRPLCLCTASNGYRCSQGDNLVGQVYLCAVSKTLTLHKLIALRSTTRQTTKLNAVTPRPSSTSSAIFRTCDCILLSRGYVVLIHRGRADRLSLFQDTGALNRRARPIFSSAFINTSKLIQRWWRMPQSSSCT